MSDKDYYSKYLKYKSKYLHTIHTHRGGGWFMYLKNKKYYVSNLKSDDRTDPLLKINFRDFLNVKIFRLLDLNTGIFDGITMKSSMKDANHTALEKELVEAYKQYLKSMSKMPCDTNDFNGDIYIYILDQSLLPEFLKIETLYKYFFKDRENVWEWRNKPSSGMAAAEPAPITIALPPNATDDEILRAFKSERQRLSGID